MTSSGTRCLRFWCWSMLRFDTFIFSFTEVLKRWVFLSRRSVLCDPISCACNDCIKTSYWQYEYFKSSGVLELSEEVICSWRSKFRPRSSAPMGISERTKFGLKSALKITGTSASRPTDKFRWLEFVYRFLSFWEAADLRNRVLALPNSSNFYFWFPI